MCSFDNRKKYEYESKWTDFIQRDINFFGLGRVNNQLQYANGSKRENPYEDRSFAYELKENQIFAYGILDGYNGTWAVDLLEKVLLSNIYFDHINVLQKKSDSEIFEILDTELYRAEHFLRDQSQDILTKRATRSVLDGAMRKGTAEYLENVKEVKNLDNQINIGAFGIISLLIDDRLFVTNVGPSHCFVCLCDKNKNKQIVTLNSIHNTGNMQEVNRLENLKAHVSEIINNENLSFNFTRCFGDFKLKFYYHEFDAFRDCTGPPIIFKPENKGSSVKIDDSVLFMAMYSDGLAKALEKTNLNGNGTSANTIALMLIQKIMSEQTLNSAAQSVLDEIKRAFDDTFSNRYSEREDFTLIVRVFDLNIKNKLISLENQTSLNSSRELTFIEDSFETLNLEDYEQTNATNYSDLSSSLQTTNLSNDQTAKSKRKNKPCSELLDQNDKVIPYIKFDELEKELESNENKLVFDEFCAQLEDLAKN